jgi:fumarate hydratase subunit alpha
MLLPSDRQGIRKFVVETVLLAEGKPCPPVILGIGIGGTFDGAAALAKEGVFVYAWRGVTNDEYYWCVDQVLNHNPNITMDDGSDLVTTLHTKKKKEDSVMLSQEQRRQLQELTASVLWPKKRSLNIL